MTSKSPRPSSHPAALPEKTLLAECDTTFGRRGGPGGQHRNKVETAVILLHRPTGVRAEANERRSQGANRLIALERLRIQLALEVRSNIEKDKELSPLWVSRLRGKQIEISRKHADFPALLAEALDRIAVCSADVRLAAEKMKTNTSQMIRFLKKEPKGLTLVNRLRSEQGMPPLK